MSILLDKNDNIFTIQNSTDTIIEITTIFLYLNYDNDTGILSRSSTPPLIAENDLFIYCGIC